MQEPARAPPSPGFRRRGQNAPATGSSGRAAARRRRQRRWVRRTPPPLPGTPGGPAPRRAPRARGSRAQETSPRAFRDLESGCRALPGLAAPAALLRARQPPCGRSSLVARAGSARGAAHAPGDAARGRRTDRAGELEQALWPRGAERRGPGLRWQGAVGSQGGVHHPGAAHGDSGGGSGLVQMRPERRRKAGETRVRGAGNPRKKGVKQKCEGGAGEHGRGREAPARKGN